MAGRTKDLSTNICNRRNRFNLTLDHKYVRVIPYILSANYACISGNTLNTACIARSEEILEEIRRKFDKRPEGWQVLVGRSPSGFYDMLFSCMHKILEKWHGRSYLPKAVGEAVFTILSMTG